MNSNSQCRRHDTLLTVCFSLRLVGTHSRISPAGTTQSSIALAGLGIGSRISDRKLKHTVNKVLSSSHITNHNKIIIQKI
jgi:hypothetical protein